MFDLYSGILRMTECFRDDEKDIVINYLLDADYKNLRETYNLEKIAGQKSDFNKAVNLLDWISSHIHHSGNYNNHIMNTAIELFKYAFDKGEECGINCRSLSLALTECLLALGIKARTIYIMPFSPYDFDNHVVCEAWISELGKWVMFDPTYNLYVLNNDERPLGILEIRKLLANQDDIIFSDKANYNGKSICKDEIVSYYAKDLFRFMLCDIQGSNSEAINGRKMINITPVGYDVKQCTLANIDFRAKKWGDNENLRNWRKSTEEDTIIHKGLDILK